MHRRRISRRSDDNNLAELTEAEAGHLVAQIYIANNGITPAREGYVVLPFDQIGRPKKAILGRRTIQLSG